VQAFLLPGDDRRPIKRYKRVNVVKITILYVSITGNTEKTAEYIKEGILSAGEIEVRLMNLASEETIDHDFIEASRAVIFGTPTYVANMCWQLKKWFDTDWNCNLAGKIGAAFATANVISGGADVAILSVINHLLVKGMLAYSSGAGCGRPFIHLGPIAIRGELGAKKDVFVLFGKRIAEKSMELFENTVI
jgi:NAD(P)H dehydrogenase (quinone)